VPPVACTNMPARSPTAPVKAPRSWPNSSEPISSRGMAPQLSATYGPSARRDVSWMAWATTSLPVPVSPRINTLQSVPAARAACSTAARSTGSRPTSRSKPVRTRVGGPSATRWVRPIDSTVPGVSSALSTRRSLMNVPLRLPESRTNQVPLRRSSTQCTRDTHGSGSAMSQLSPLPMT
jgi:hypothetical protein